MGNNIGELSEKEERKILTLQEFQELLDRETANWPKDEFLEIMSFDEVSDMGGVSDRPVVHTRPRSTRAVGIVERFFSTIDWHELKDKTLDEDYVPSEEAILDSCED